MMESNRSDWIISIVNYRALAVSFSFYFQQIEVLSYWFGVAQPAKIEAIAKYFYILINNFY